MLVFLYPSLFKKSHLTADFDVCNACFNSNIPVAFPIFEAETCILFIAFISLMNICEMLTSALWFWVIMSEILENHKPDLPKPTETFHLENTSEKGCYETAVLGCSQTELKYHC